MGDITAKIRYVGLIRNVVGCQEEEVSIREGSDVGELLHSLATKYGEGFRTSVLTADGKLRHYAKVAINDRDIGEIKGLDTVVTNNTQVSILVTVHPIAGG